MVLGTRLADHFVFGMFAAYRCNLCNGFLAVSVRLLVNHLFRNHKSDPHFHVLCGLGGCARTYSNFYSFRNHIVRKHKDLYDSEVEQCDVISTNEEETEEGLQGDFGDVSDTDILESDLDENRRKRISALCILKFKEEGRVPQTVVDLFVQNSTDIVQSSIDYLKSEVKEKLHAEGVDFGVVPGLTELFAEDNDEIRNPFSGLEKESQQYHYYKEHFGLVEPKEIVLAQYHVRVRRKNKFVLKTKRDTAYYIPLLESLQQLMNDDSILEQIYHPHARDDDMLCDFCDGEHFKAHPLFGIDPYALQLLVYYDDLEVCNPLGTRANKHKLGAFYYTLGNIRPENRSHMNSIQLLGLINSKHVKKYGVEPILEAFLHDVSQLEQDAGHQFTINGAPQSFRGTIGYCSGDNLGSQLLGGFKEGARAHRPCRECMGTTDEIKVHFHENFFVLRTKDSYDEQCQRLTLGEHFSKTYGLNKRSCLTQSRYYHVVGGLPADAMHDILEGVLQYCIKVALKVFVCEKQFLTLDELNKRIVTFDYGYHNDTNKPAQIQRKKLVSDEKSLKQHANQMWCLALHLPLLIGNVIPEDDEHWELVCQLLEIVRIVFSPMISKDQMPYLQVLVEYHHDKFKQLYPEYSIIPKMHYMVHMPRIILQLGPLSRSWCMRYEAKHHYFKRLAITLGNFINISYSLSKRHQEGLCYKLQSSQGSLTSFVEKGTETGPGRNTYAGASNYLNLLLAEHPGLYQQTPIYETKWVTILGTKYKIGAILHIGYNDNGLPQFWEIIRLLVLDRNIRDINFIMYKMENVQFNTHFQSYEVAYPVRRQTKIEYHRNFTCFLPLNQTKPMGSRNNTKYVCMRYELGTSD